MYIQTKLHTISTKSKQLKHSTISTYRAQWLGIKTLIPRNGLVVISHYTKHKQITISKVEVLLYDSSEKCNASTVKSCKRDK